MTVMAAPPHQAARDLHRVETLDAWFEYLETTRDQGQFRYDEVEPWAWARLQQRLRAIDGRLAATTR